LLNAALQKSCCAIGRGRMARPKKTLKKTEPVTVRFTKAEKRIIEKYAERSGIRLAEFIHDRSLGHKVQAILTEEEVLIFRQLTGLANNLNQLAKRSHQRKLLTAQILETLEGVNLVIKKIKS